MGVFMEFTRAERARDAILAVWENRKSKLEIYDESEK
jgi:hypothetical protein